LIYNIYISNYKDLEWEEEMANQHHHYCWCKNIGNTEHHELQDTIRIFDSISPSSYDRCREENGHHLQLHGPSVLIMVCKSKTWDPANDKRKLPFRLNDILRSCYNMNISAKQITSLSTKLINSVNPSPENKHKRISN